MEVPGACDDVYDSPEKKTCPRYFIQFKNRLRYSHFDPSNATSQNISAVLLWIKLLGCDRHRSAHCVGWFSPLLLPSFYPFFFALERFLHLPWRRCELRLCRCDRSENSGKSLWNWNGERSHALHKRADQYTNILR